MLVFALAATRFFAPAVMERTKGSSPAQSSSRSLAGCAGREQPHHVPRAPGRRTGTAAAPARPPRCCPHPRRAAGLLNTKVPKVLATETNPFPASFPILPFVPRDCPCCRERLWYQQNTQAKAYQLAERTETADCYLATLYRCYLK